jgi:acyl-CoA thioester hydrolase
VAPVHVRWSDIDMYQHINHATMVTILEEARIPFLREPFGADITTIGLLIAEVNIVYKGQLRLVDSPLQVTMFAKRVRAVDFTIGYEVRPAGATPDTKPSVIADTQLAAIHIDEQRLQRLSPAQREYLLRHLR